MLASGAEVFPTEGDRHLLGLIELLAGLLSADIEEVVTLFLKEDFWGSVAWSSTLSVCSVLI